MNYIVGFEMSNGEIYVYLRNTKNNNIVFYEKVTEQALRIVEEYSKKING